MLSEKLSAVALLSLFELLGYCVRPKPYKLATGSITLTALGIKQPDKF